MSHTLTGLIFCINFLFARGQAEDLPVKEWISSDETPLVLYLSGDGGLNTFSNNVCKAIIKSGNSISAINSKTYFWEQKTPAQTTSDISEYLNNQFQGRKNQQLVLAGYSFGAEIIPFVVNRMPDSLRRKIVQVILVAPSASTDFEIHWLDLLGVSRKKSMDVISEMNKMGSQKTVIIAATNDHPFPFKDVKLKNFKIEYLPGGHHFDNHPDELARVMQKHFK